MEKEKIFGILLLFILISSFLSGCVSKPKYEISSIQNEVNIGDTVFQDNLAFTLTKCQYQKQILAYNGDELFRAKNGSTFLIISYIGTNLPKDLYKFIKLVDDSGKEYSASITQNEEIDGKSTEIRAIFEVPESITIDKCAISFPNVKKIIEYKIE